MEDIYSDISQWIKKISTRKKGYQICPYAKKAKYKIFINQDKLSIQQHAMNWSEKYDLVICKPIDLRMSLFEAKIIVDLCNTKFKNTITLLDHPVDPGFINGTYTGNGKHILFLIQSKIDLLKARKHLKTTSYYNNWTDSYYKLITGESKS